MSLGPGARVAAYYAPDPADSLWRAGSAWLGYDALTRAVVAQPAIQGLAASTRTPARYGFHATLKPPFHLAPRVGWNDLGAALAGVCAGREGFAMPALEVGVLDGFLALVSRDPSPRLHALADALVAGLDHLRASQPVRPPPAWRFHMTLSERLEAGTADRLRAEAERFFQPALACARRVDSVCLFVQPAPGESFQVKSKHFFF